MSFYASTTTSTILFSFLVFTLAISYMGMVSVRDYKMFLFT